MTFATIADLEGLADGTTVFVRQTVTATNGTEFVKREKGLERMDSVVPFRLFTGAVEQGLVSEHQSPEPGTWWQRGTWTYYVVSSTPTEVTYLPFSRGMLGNNDVRTRPLERWEGTPKTRVESTEEFTYREALGSLLNLGAMAAQIGRLAASVDELRDQARAHNGAQARVEYLQSALREIGEIAETATR